MFRSLILAAALLAFTPLAANAGEITLLPSIKLQIGDRDNYGNYWDGGHWRDRGYWHNNYEWRKIAGGVMITVIIVVGISAKRTSAVTVKAGTIAMTIAVAAKATDVVMATIINVTKEPAGSFAYNPSAVPTSSQRFSATTSTTIIQPTYLTQTVLTKSPLTYRYW